MKSSAKKVELASVDDLFSTEESRADAQREKVVEIPLSELHPFKGHPFKVKDDEAMMETADSIKQYGVLVNHLIAVAKDTGCAIVIIAHMNKMKDNNPLYRTNGSIDIAGAVRSILAITRTPNKEAPAERYLVQVKSNLAPTGSAILFEVAEKGVDFISEMEMTAEEAFLSLAPQMGRPNEKEMKAKSFLIEMLQDGEMLSSDCEEKLEAAGFKKSTIKKAKKNAGVISKKKGFLWYWSLPMGDIPRE